MSTPVNTAATAAAAAPTPTAPYATGPVPYADEPECSPPPYYTDCESQGAPHQSFYHVDETEVSDALPEYSFYDLESGSFVEHLLNQYARSVGPGDGGDSTILTFDSDGDSVSSQDDLSFAVRFQQSFLYAMALFCGISWAVAWVGAIVYAATVSLQKIVDHFP